MALLSLQQLVVRVQCHKALSRVIGIVKDITTCCGKIGSLYKEAYLDLYRCKFNKTDEKQHCINKLNTSLNKTDSSIGMNYSAQSSCEGKHSLQDTIDLMMDSPFTESTTTASPTCTTASTKAKATIQATITNFFMLSTTTTCCHPESIRAANVAFAH